MAGTGASSYTRDACVGFKRTLGHVAPSRESGVSPALSESSAFRTEVRVEQRILRVARYPPEASKKHLNVRNLGVTLLNTGETWCTVSADCGIFKYHLVMAYVKLEVGTGLELAVACLPQGFHWSRAAAVAGKACYK